MAIDTNYLDMPIMVEDLDQENLAYFQHCADHQFHLQACTACKQLRYPPTTACPFCANLESEWKPVEGKGTVCTYEEVHHAIQPSFKPYLPYLVLLVELDTQKGQPTENDALRVLANLTDENGTLAPPEVVKQVGIGSRVRMVFSNVDTGIALPQWTLDEDAEQPEKPWRYIYE